MKYLFLCLLALCVNAEDKWIVHDHPAKIIRETEDGPKEIDVNLKELLYKGDLNLNFELQPGDTVVVPKSRFVK